MQVYVNVYRQAWIGLCHNEVRLPANPTLSMIERAAIFYACHRVPVPDEKITAEALEAMSPYFGEGQPDYLSAFKAWTVERYANRHSPLVGIRNPYPAGATLLERAKINLLAASRREEGVA